MEVHLQDVVAILPPAPKSKFDRPPGFGFHRDPSHRSPAHRPLNNNNNNNNNDADAESKWLLFNTTDDELARHFDRGSSPSDPLFIRFTPSWGAEGHVWEGQVVGNVNHRTGIISVKFSSSDYAIRQIADHDVVLTTYNSIASNRLVNTL